MGTAVGNQSDLSSAYKSSDERVIKVKVIVMYDLGNRGRRGKEADLFNYPTNLIFKEVKCFHWN